MQLNRITIEVLKNCATINQGILIRPGTTIRTMNINRNAFLNATVPDEFPMELAVYDLNELLTAISLLDNPELDFKDDHVLMTSGVETTFYYYSSPSVVVSPPDKNVKFPGGDKTFRLTRAIFDKIQRNSAAMKLKHVKIDADGLQVFNRDNVSGNVYRIGVDVDVTGQDVETILTVDSLKLIPCDYNVEISNKGLVHFTSDDEDLKLEYFIALDK